MGVEGGATLAINGVVADFGNESLRDADGNDIVLRPQVFAVLRYLSDRPNRLVSKDELMAAVWPGVAVTDDSLVQCIHEIRRAINDVQHSVLRTIPRRGYRLVLPEGTSVAPVVAAAALVSAPALPPQTWGVRAWIAVAVAAVLVAGAILGWWAFGRVASLPTSGPPAIAVLPFENLGDDPEQGYFADGMTEDLITDLSKISGVFVIARNSVWPYKGHPVDVKEVASRLGVRYVLEGSVRRDTDRVRINAQLIDAVDGRHLWADRYDGTLSDVFAVQDRVISQIVTALAVELTSAERAETGQIETTNPQAYDALLLGRDYLRRGTEQDTLKATSLFEKAIALDPGFSRAYASLAAAQWRTTLAFWFSSAGAGWQHSYEGLIRNLAKAKEKPTSLAYAVSAQVLSQQGRYDEAFADIEHAMALAPNDPDNHTAKASILNATGRASEAEAEVRIAMRLDPQYAPATLRILAISLFNQEKYAEAAEALRRVIAQESDVPVDYSTLVSALGHLGRHEGVETAIAQYNAIAVPAAYDPLTVQESAYDWYGLAFSYYRPYLLRMQEGLRLAGVPEGAGTDLELDDYVRFISRHEGEFEVAGATKVDTTAARALRARGVPFVDVRAQVDYANGHIPGAVNLSLPVGLSSESLASVVGRDAEVVFYCHGKYCPYSAYASAKAIAWGWHRVYYFAGGFPSWQDAGNPVETTPAK
jgi:TolB-like protein/DNA-binding winged helix-turn-helix (wHTH) protein/rhodanese-related sulfurtransferase/Flp pilus assembly protein TadD